MNDTGTVNLTANINQSCEKVWNILTTKELFEDCFSFLKMECHEWKKGGKIFFESQNSSKIDYAVILECIRGEKLSYQYYKMNSDIYQEMAFSLKQTDENSCILSITAENFKNQEEYQHSETAWSSMLNTLKLYSEKKNSRCRLPHLDLYGSEW